MAFSSRTAAPYRAGFAWSSVERPIIAAISLAFMFSCELEDDLMLDRCGAALEHQAMLESLRGDGAGSGEQRD